jgi:hypothetical protein
MTGVRTSQSLMEQCMQKPFKHLADDERRTAFKEFSGEAEKQVEG